MRRTTEDQLTEACCRLAVAASHVRECLSTDFQLPDDAPDCEWEQADLRLVLLILDAAKLRLRRKAVVVKGVTK